MQHLVLKAQTVSTDQELGEFEAIVSAWQADREGDVIDRHAFDETIQAWQRSGKMLPLLAEHSTTVIGHIDPMTMHPTDQGLVVYGEVDRDTEEGTNAWRSIKNGTAGFSIGFAADSEPRAGGGRTLTSIDLLEVSFTPRPMHPATRALAWKSASYSFDEEFQMFKEVDAKAEAAHEQQRRDRELKKLRDEELEKWIAELEAKAAKKEKRNRPVIVKRIEVG
jgi:HK97 family phage prohead protease